MDPEDLIPAPEPSVPEVAADNVRQGAALGVDPDEEGRLLDRSVQSGIPVQQLRGEPPARVDELLGRNRRLRAYQRSAKLAQWVADNPRYADISRDDELALERIQHATDKWLDLANAPTTGAKFKATVLDAGRGFAQGVGQLGKSAYGNLALVSGIHGAVTGSDISQSAAQMFQELAESAPDAATALKADLHGISVAEMNRREAASKAQAGSVFGIGASDITSGAVSLLPALAGGVFSAGSKAAVAGVAALQSSGGAYTDAREDGQGVGEAAARAALSGTITGTLTRYFGPNLEAKLTSSLAGAAIPRLAAKTMLVKTIGINALQEFGEEGVDQFLQELLVNGSDLKTAVDAGLKAGLVGGVLGGAMSVGQAVRQAKVAGADEFHSRQDEIVQAIDLSKTGERSSAALASYLQAVAPGLKNAPAVFSADDLAPLVADPAIAEELQKIGITPEVVAEAQKSGMPIRSTQEKVLVGLPKDVREKVRPFMREDADSLSKKEVEEHKAEASKSDKTEVAAEAKRMVSAVKKERARILKEMGKASKEALPPEARQQLQTVLDRAAASLAERSPEAGRKALDLLQKITFAEDSNLTPAEIRQQITNAAGVGGKTALRGVEIVSDLGDLSGRFDPLTGRVTVNSAAIKTAAQVSKVIATAAGRGRIDLAGKKVRKGATEVDAAAEVDKLSSDLEMARRLKDCVG